MQDKQKESANLPSVSIVVPTFNSQRTVERCLQSIFCQDYPSEKIETIIVDGGSQDETLKTVLKFPVDIIVQNPRRTGEAGKAVGILSARNEIILLQDSDNILEVPTWIRRMVEPFRDNTIVGAEPIYYTYRAEDSLITRYCALIGMNDPTCLYIGNYDRFNYISKKWTGFDIRTCDRGNYLEFSLTGKAIPTMGSNGFLVRRTVALAVKFGSYLFDVDLIYDLVREGNGKFAKVKIGIVHLFADDISTYMRKTLRRIRDYLYYNKQRARKYPWAHLSRIQALRFALYTIIVFPIARDCIRGYRTRPERAWLFHPLACWLTLLIYTAVFFNPLIRMIYRGTTNFHLGRSNYRPVFQCVQPCTNPYPTREPNTSSSASSP